MPAMLGCSTVCPNCKHQFSCCASPCGHRQQQMSPSGALTFVMPPSAAVALLPPPPTDGHEAELQRLADTVRALRLSGWYYEGLNYHRSDQLLKNSKVGTFLVRNSSDPRYLFSLSMQTEHGPKSVRLFYINGNFRLDAQAHQEAIMPSFPGVLELIEYYVRKAGKSNGQVWVDPEGKWSERMNLQRPLRKEGKPPQLKHLSRLAVNRALSDNAKLKMLQLDLPTSLMAYLAEYPYSL